jgi:hypothetical protein
MAHDIMCARVTARGVSHFVVLEDTATCNMRREMAHVLGGRAAAVRLMSHECPSIVGSCQVGVSP